MLRAYQNSLELFVISRYECRSGIIFKMFCNVEKYFTIHPPPGFLWQNVKRDVQEAWEPASNFSYEFPLVGTDLEGCNLWPLLGNNHENVVLKLVSCFLSPKVVAITYQSVPFLLLLVSTLYLQIQTNKNNTNMKDNPNFKAHKDNWWLGNKSFGCLFE